MSVTIKKIAELAGVAPTTVSLVLRDSHKVGAETKKNVLRIIEEMDYYPNQSGKFLKQGRTDAVAVISSYFQSLFKMDFVNGLESGIFNSDYELRQYYAKTGHETDKCKEILFSKMADVAILMSVITNGDFLHKMQAKGKQVLLVEDVVPGFPGVNFDNFAAAYGAVQFLASKGRRRIAISLNLQHFVGHSFVDERLRGYQAALKDLDIDDTDIIDLASYSLESGRSIFATLRAKDRLPEALFCASGDLTAAGFIKEALAHGVRIPDDIAVMGFDDSIIAQSITLGLTTVRQPVFEMGKAAFDLAMALINGEPEATSRIVTFQPEIIIRESV